MAASGSQTNRGTVLITGGTDGLGRAAAIFLAERGYRVFAGGRNRERLASLEQLSLERKLSLEALELDVCSDDSANNAIAEIERRAGPVDVLVNNAGIAIGAVMEEITLADLRKQYETNVFSVVRMSQRVLPEMRRRRRGRIINMSSVAGKVAGPVMGPYSSSKHALEGVSDSMRLELYPFGISVVLIEPGFISTSINRNAMELSAAYAQGMARSPYSALYERFRKSVEGSMSGSRTTPEDCARVILRAIEAPRPRARYRVTTPGKIILTLRWLLPDGVMDALARRGLGLEKLRKELARKAEQ